jgi:hypothetical protein
MDQELHPDSLGLLSEGNWINLDRIPHHPKSRPETLCLKEAGRETMDAGPDLCQGSRSTWRGTDGVQDYDANLATRESKISSILAKIQASSIGENHRVINLTEALHTPVLFFANQFLEARFQHLHTSFGVINQNIR